MEIQSNKVIGIIGTPKSVDQYIAANFSNTNHNYTIFDMNEKIEETRNVLECMRIWSEEYALQKFNEDDLITFLYIARLDGRIDTQIAKLTIGEKKRLLFLKAMLANCYYYIIHELFDGVDKKDIEILTQMLIELSTYATIVLTAENDNGFSICDKIIILSY